MVYLLSEIDLDKFEFAAERSYDEGSKSTSLLYAGDSFSLQTPYVFCPFGLSEYNTEFSHGHALAFNCPPDLLDFFENMDSELQFQREGTYVPLVKRRDGKPPLIRIKVDPSKMPEVPPKSKARMILQLLPLWETNGRFGISFRILKIQVKSVNFR